MEQYPGYWDLLMHWSCTKVLFGGQLFLWHLHQNCVVLASCGTCEQAHAVSGPTSDLLVFSWALKRGSAQAGGRWVALIWTFSFCTWRILSIKRGIYIRICITNVSQVICFSLKLWSTSEVHLKSWIEDNITVIFNTALCQLLHGSSLKQSWLSLAQKICL